MGVLPREQRNSAVNFRGRMRPLVFCVPRSLRADHHYLILDNFLLESILDLEHALSSNISFLYFFSFTNE